MSVAKIKNNLFEPTGTLQLELWAVDYEENLKKDDYKFRSGKIIGK